MAHDDTVFFLLFTGQRAAATNLLLSGFPNYTLES
jgi:hypothetical protein